MDEIRLLALKVLRLMFISAFILPPIILLLIAAINKHVRRIVLIVMVVLAVLAVLSVFVFAPYQPSTMEDWSVIGKTMQAGLVAALPFLVALLFLALVAYMIGPYVMERLEEWLHRRQRQHYLSALLQFARPRLADFVRLPGQATLLEGDNPAWVRIQGDSGAGASMLLHDTFVRLVNAAQADASRPMPVLINLDDLADLDLLEPRPRQLVPLQPVRLPLLEWLFRREARKRRLIFLIDSSQQTFSPAFVTRAEQESLLRALDGMIDYFAPCPTILVLPVSVHDASIERTLQSCQELELLNDGQMSKLLEAWLGSAERAVQLSQSLLSGGTWEQLSRRPLILHQLAIYTRQNGSQRLPGDLRGLFRGTLLDKQTRCEPGLIRLAQEMYQQRRPALPRQTVENLLQAGSQAEEWVSALIKQGALRETRKLAGKAQAEPCLEFAHPLYLSYFTALGWLDPRGRTSLHGDPDRLRDDPLLVDALIFFNNIAANQSAGSSPLPALLEQIATAAEPDSGPFREYLVTQCLLAMSPAARPGDLLEVTAARLVQACADDDNAGRQAFALMGPLDSPARLAIYQRALASMDLPHLTATLRQISTPLTGQISNSEEIRMLLWRAMPELAFTVGVAWGDIDPGDAFALFREMYEDGPTDRRALAVNLLGELPREAVEEYLYGLLQQPSSPELRVGQLSAMLHCGSDMIFPLLNLVASPEEPEQVRIFAAQALSESTSSELHAPNAIREIVRISHLPMPERAAVSFTNLLEHLRHALPGGVERWEAVANPYVVGRPVSDPNMLFGRSSTLHTLRSAIENGNHVLLHGERRIGKSSILHALLRELRAEASQVPTRAVYLDLQGLAPHELYETVMLAALEQVRERGLHGDPQFPRPYADGIFERDIHELIAFLKKRLGAQARLVIIMDEADAVIGYPQSMQLALRRILSSSAANGLVVILASSDPQRWTRPDSPFYNLFSLCPVPRLKTEDARQLITRPLAGSMQFEPDAIEVIENAAQGRPYEIQALCQQMINDRLVHGENIITAETVRQALRAEPGGRAELLNQSENLLTNLMDWLETHPEASNAEIEAHLKETWEGLRHAMVRQVMKMKKMRPGSE